MSFTVRHPITLALAAVAWLALALQGWITISGALRAGAPPVRAVADYLLYFTTLTNGVCALILTARVRDAGAGRRTEFFLRNGTVTSATVSILIVALLYHFLLRTRPTPEGLEVISAIALNYVMPISFSLYWWEYVPGGALAVRDAWRWLLYPIGYAFYVFLRGALVGQYQYFFVDAGDLGLAVAVRNAGLVTLVFFAIAAILVGVNRFAGHVDPLET